MYTIHILFKNNYYLVFFDIRTIINCADVEDFVQNLAILRLFNLNMDMQMEAFA